MKKNYGGVDKQVVLRRWFCILFFVVCFHNIIHTLPPWRKQCHPQPRRRQSPPKQKVRITPLFNFLRSLWYFFIDKSTVWRFDCFLVPFFFINVVVATRNPVTFLLLRIHKERHPLFPNKIRRISHVNAEDNQLFFKVIRTFIDFAIIISIILFIVALDPEVYPQTLCRGVCSINKVSLPPY